jgi:hypothetical protein
MAHNQRQCEHYYEHSNQNQYVHRQHNRSGFICNASPNKVDKSKFTLAMEDLRRGNTGMQSPELLTLTNVA